MAPHSVHSPLRPAPSDEAASTPSVTAPIAVARSDQPSAWAPRARTALAAFAALALLPVLALAGLAFAGAIDGDTLQAVTPAVMMLPALAAVFVWSVTRPLPFGRAMRLRPERGWPRAVGWSLVALVVIAALGALTGELAVGLGIAQPGADALAVLPAVPGVFATMLVLSLAEEVGWRGFGQRLLAPIGLVRASLAIAAFWALWHAPAMAVWVWEGSMPLEVALTTLGSLLLGGLVLSALSALGGSVWPAVVGHAAMNSLVVYATSTRVTGDPAAIGALGWMPWAVAAVVGLLLAGRAVRARRAAA